MISSGWCACVYASAILLRGSCFRFAEWPYISAARRGVVTPLAGRYAADLSASAPLQAELVFANRLDTLLPLCAHAGLAADDIYARLLRHWIADAQRSVYEARAPKQSATE